MNWKNCLARQRKEDKYDDKFGFVGMMEMEQKLMCYLAEQIRGVSYKPDDLHKQLDENSVILLRANNIDDGQINFDDVVYVDRSKVSCSQFLRKGDILVCASSGSRNLVGKAAQIDFEGNYTFGAFCKVVRPKEIDAEYLGMYFLSPTYRSIIASLAQGANINNIKNEHIDSLIVNIGNENECQQIVNILSRLLKVIHLRQQEIKELDDLIKARFVEMFGDPMTNPKGYPVRVLSEIAEYWNGLTYKPEDVANEGTIVLRSSNIQDATLDFKDTVRVSCEISDKKYVKDNDILMCSRNGSARLVGKVALIRNIDEPMSFGAFMMIIRSAYYSYLMTYFQMPAFRTQITTGATTTINQITGKILDAVKLPVPDLYTINEFSDFVNQVDKSKFVYY